MAIKYRILDLMRRGRTAHENHLIDGLVAGRVSRREFMRHGSVLGLWHRSWAASRQPSVFGHADFARAATPGGTIRIAQTVPAAAIDPVKIADGGGITVVSQVARDTGPVRRRSDGAARAGRELGAEQGRHGLDLQAAQGRQVPQRQDDDRRRRGGELRSHRRSGQRLECPVGAAPGVLSKGGTARSTITPSNSTWMPPMAASPIWSPPTTTMPSSCRRTYAGDFEQNMIGTGPFKLEKYTPKVGASFVRNTDYWGDQALPDRSRSASTPTISRRSWRCRAARSTSSSRSRCCRACGLLNDPNFDIISTPSTAHQQVHMRTDLDPFKDKRVRRAIALCLDRPKLVAGPDEGPRQDRQRQSVRGGLSRRPTRACRSGRRTSPRPRS